MAGTRQAPPAPAIARQREATSDEPVAEKPGRSPFVRIALIGAGTVVLVIALVFGLRYVAYASAHETTDDATIDADEVQLTSKIGERVARIAVDTNGTVRKGQLLIALDNRDETDRVLQARAAVDAQRAQARAAQENVALARDTQTAQNLQNSGTVAQARAAISGASENARSAAGQIAVARAGVDAARAQLRAARDAVPAGRENLRRAQADLRRVSSLVSTGDVAAQQLDAARAAYATANATYAEVQAQVGTAVANLDQAQQKLDAQRFSTSSSQALVGVQQGQLTTAQGKLLESGAPSRVLAQQAQAEAAQAQVASLNASLVTAKNNLSYTRIVSPIDGFVGQKNVEVGQTVAAGAPLLTLIPSNRFYITANFKETQVGKMRVGQRCDINVDAYKGVKFSGHIDNLSPASQNKFSLVPAQNATGNFVKVTQRLPVRVLFDRVEGGTLSDYTLRPGMSVETSCEVKH
ncbi:MAG: HlyD family secretion protein [Vulcanimicrobiaceae bacterium]